MRRVLPLAPLYLVNFLLDLQRFQIVELGLVRLELSVELVLASLFLAQIESESLAERTRRDGATSAQAPRKGQTTHCFIPLKENDAAALITRGEVVAR